MHQPALLVHSEHVQNMCTISGSIHTKDKNSVMVKLFSVLRIAILVKVTDLVK
jgi:CO/xanthine dehydrogenase FAD-binding subunit